MRRRGSRRSIAASVVVVVILGIASLVLASQWSGQPDAEALPASSTPVSEHDAAQRALGSLDSVPVTVDGSIPDYDRELFGEGWGDPDGNGCDTRNDVLARDLTVTAVDEACRVLSGTLADPYTGRSIEFVRGEHTSDAVQIDHLVSLSGAWRSGAYAWPEARRLAFANDPANLRAVDGPANNSKGDRGPARWMPAQAGNPAFDCRYAIEYTDVLVTYELSAPAEDLTALESTLASC